MVGFDKEGATVELPSFGEWASDLVKRIAAELGIEVTE